MHKCRKKPRVLNESEANKRIPWRTKNQRTKRLYYCCLAIEERTYAIPRRLHSSELLEIPDDFGVDKIRKLIGRMDEVAEKLPELFEGDNGVILFKITKTKQFLNGGGSLISVPEDDAREVVQEGASLSVLINFEARFLHEMCHVWRADFDDMSETVPMLAQVLYDPKDNEIGNKTYQRIGANTISELQGGNGEGRYTLDWINTMKIMLKVREMLEMGFRVPKSDLELVRLTTETIEFFKTVPWEIRKGIIIQHVLAR